jgi:hypothetical protein
VPRGDVRDHVGNGLELWLQQARDRRRRPLDLLSILRKRLLRCDCAIRSTIVFSF